MASIINTNKTDLVKKRYKLLFSHDNNYCSMPSYLYNTSSNKLEPYSIDTDFRLKDKTHSMLSSFEQLYKQKQLGEQNNVNILEVNLSQTVYPREENTFLNGTVKRENYTFPWRDSITSRYNNVSSSQLDTDTITFQDYAKTRLFSMWPLDCGTYDVSSPVSQGELMFKNPDNILYARFGRDLNKSGTPQNSVQIQAGKGPFSDSYDNFVSDIKLIYKDYSVLPEYTISDKLRSLLLSGESFYSDAYNTLTVRGTSSYTTNQFLEKYVNSDYVDSSKEVEDNFGNLSSIKISVNGVKKLLPYDGFYPQQRTLQLSTLFSQSIAPSTTLAGTAGTFRTVSNWIFSRGLYNSIRAGIACDLPIWQSGALSDTATTYDRLPFLTLLNPNSYVQKGYQIIDFEPLDDSSRTITLNSTASLGQSDGIYDLAMNNFAAETCNFFLSNSSLTSLRSKSQNEWKFDFSKYSSFTMNVVLNKNSNFTNHDAVGYYGYPYNYFAPPYYALSSSAGSLWSYSVVDSAIAPSASWNSNRAIATITFDANAWSNTVTNLNNTPIPTLQDIKTFSTITYKNENIFNQASSIHNAGAFMPLSASVELFGYSPKNEQWNIHTIWETPVHNFVSVSTINSASVDGGTGNTAGNVHRGMWHQYSTNTTSGLKLSLEYSSSIANRNTGSLIEACGFEMDSKMIGNIADNKTIYEYVVVIPYVVDDCQVEKYFKIPLDTFENEYARAEHLEDDNSIRDLIRKSRKCVLPPKLNFVDYRDRHEGKILNEGEYTDTLPPFAMYIFEFSANLSRQDISNIWQGVSPTLTDISELQNIGMEHPINEYEVIGPHNLANYGGKLPQNTRFKVFKVKARSLSTYNELAKKTIGERTKTKMYGFNWPYDYFSLVEMAKVDVELGFNLEKEKAQ